MKALRMVCKAIGEPHRLDALLALRDGELCVCHLIELMQLRPGTVSRHMGVLKHAGLVEARRAGKWQYVRLPKNPSPLVASALAWAFETVKHDPIAKNVRRRAREIRAIPAVELCDHYR
jgi:DNA-binding transcriptional ArsR family regulator